jgi:hypothetical protein
MGGGIIAEFFSYEGTVLKLWVQSEYKGSKANPNECASARAQVATSGSGGFGISPAQQTVALCDRYFPLAKRATVQVSDGKGDEPKNTAAGAR